MINRRIALTGFIVVAMLIVSLIGWQQYQSFVYKQYVSDARKSLQQNQFKRAKELASRAIAIDGSDQESLRILAMASYREDDFASAAAAFDQLRDVSFEEMQYQAFALAVNGDHLRAADLWRSIDPSLGDRSIALDQFLHEVHKRAPTFDKDLFLRHLLRDGTFRYPKHLETLANQDLAVHDVESGIDHWEQLTKIHPDHETSHLNLAQLMIRTGKLDRAKTLIAPFASAKAEWLRSRIHLLNNQREPFIRSVQLATKLGLKPGMLVEPASFVGSATCAECHPKHADGQQKTHHALTFGYVKQDNDPALDDTKTLVDGLDAKFHHHIRREGDRVHASVWSNDRDRKTLEFIYRIGSGLHGVTYLSKDDSRWVEYRLSKYHAINPPWDVTTGQNEFSGVNRAEGKVIDEGIRRECLRCHSTNTSALFDHEKPTKVDLGIRCEVCHGPGDHHVKLARAELLSIDPGLRNPKRMTAAESVAVRASCHKPKGMEPTPEVLARPDIVRFQAIGLVASKCYKQSNELRCTTCHNPHKSEPVTIAEHVGNCVKCHPASKPLPCPTDANKNCIDCHMPKVEGMRHSKFADHFIRIIAK